MRPVPLADATVRRMPALSLMLLGEPRLAAGGVEIACSAKKALGVFVYVALVGGRRPRRELARLFWGGDEEAARTSLRTALQRLPQPLAQALAIERESIALLDASSVRLDSAEFAALAERDDATSLQQAADLYRGELLQGLDIDAAPDFDDWLHRERARLRQLAQQVFDRLIARHRERAMGDQAHAAAGRDAAMAAARRWLALEPAAEWAHRWLIRLYVESGQRDAAEVQYEVCRRELAVKHGRQPAPETRALVRPAADDAQRTDAAAAMSGAAPAMPVAELAATRFIGRIDELAALDAMLADPGCRLLTLHGLGGAGKSRLAQVLLTQLAPRYAQGAAWVALQPVNDAAQLPQAIAAALGLRLSQAAEPAMALAGTLALQQRLVVLDNFEHLLAEPHAAAAVDLVLRLLREAPRLSVVITSREALGVQEEWVYPLDGLPYPPADAAVPALHHAAVELFVQRARQAYLGFSAPAEWPHVLRICRLVEGLPLALELAAAWVRTVPCGDLALVLEREMAATASRHRNRPPRQASLDAVVRTSWQMLATEQQHALAALAVFAGDFTLDAAQATAETSLRVLSSLIDKSLLARRHDGRVGLHELVRQFAAARLAERPAAGRDARRLHARHYAALLARCHQQLDGADELEAEAVLAAELANLLRAADTWRTDDATLAATAVPLMRALVARHRPREAIAWAERCLAAQAMPAVVRSQLLALRGRAYTSAHETDAAEADFAAAIALAREHGLTQALLDASLLWADVPFIDDRIGEVDARIEAIAPLVDASGDAVAKARWLSKRAALHHARGQHADGANALQQALAVQPTLPPTLRAALLVAIGVPLMELSRFDDAERGLREALPILERIGSPQAALLLNTLAVLVSWRAGPGASAEAADYAARALAHFERLGYASGISAAADTLGSALQALGRIDEARAQFARAATLGGPIVECEATAHLAGLELARGRVDDARALAQQHFSVADRARLPVALRTAVLLAAGVCAREAAHQARARRWLRALLAEADLDFETRRSAQALLERLAAAVDDDSTERMPFDAALEEVRAMWAEGSASGRA